MVIDPRDHSWILDASRAAMRNSTSVPASLLEELTPHVNRVRVVPIEQP